MINKTSIQIPLFFLLTFCLFISAPLADAVRGMPIEVKQPNGIKVKIYLYGDEFYSWYESSDGYTIVQDSEGWYCYAKLSQDKTLAASSIKYWNEKAAKKKLLEDKLKNMKIKKKLKPHPEKIEKMRKKRMLELNTDSDGNPINPLNGSGFPLRSPDDVQDTRVGAYVGITIAVDFSDDTATMPISEIEEYLNTPSGYNDFGNNGSIREYFSDVSNGRLDYTNTLPAYYYRAQNPSTYYTDTTIALGIRARELVTEALEYVDSVGFDFSTLSTDAGNVIYAINVFYAGTRFSKSGLWPHSWSLMPVFLADGVRSGDYQITDIGTSLTIGTFCHENGHSLLDYPDLYDGGYQSRGIGNYCLMAYQDNTNPTPPNPYLRDLSGWQTTLDATFITNDTLLTVYSNSHTAFRYLNTDQTPANEYFLIEAIQGNSGRYGTILDSGLTIWHIDRNGNNNYEQMTCALHYLVSLEQADGDFDLENNRNLQDIDDFFNTNDNDELSDITTPDACWWCNTIDGNTDSHLRVYDISAPGDSMTFRISGATDISVTHPLSISPSPIAQTILVSTGYVNLVVNLNGTGIDDRLITDAAGDASFSVIANTPDDTIWVTVGGSGFRYRGIIEVRAYIPPDTVDQVMGFEAASLWDFIFGTTGSLSNDSSTKTQGNASLQIEGNGWQQIQSVDLNTADISATSSTLNLDIFIGATQPNPWWIGEIQLYVNCPSAGVSNQFIGTVQLTDLTVGAFNTVSYNLPSNIMSILAGFYTDFAFSIALNTNPGSGPYFIDNMRF